MQNKKIFILLPDGIGLRNFAYTDFVKVGEAKGYEVIFWNITPFNLTEMGFKEIKFGPVKLHPFTEVYKNAKTRIELYLSKKRSGDAVYDGYHFKPSYKRLGSVIKNVLTLLIYKSNSSDNGLKSVRESLPKSERKTEQYKRSVDTLKREKADLIFCTNQRHTFAIAPITAAQDLGIPTASFIFSWDNLPKATMVINPDYYLVWSDLMKSQLNYYYPHIKDSQIFITGSTQFEPHYNKDLLLPREQFFANFGLDPKRRYICFSGDDIVTSPNDVQYLSDTADAIRELNNHGMSLGIIFRKCPVDFSNRYADVIENNKDIISVIDPRWKKMGGAWNFIFPEREDLALQMNTIQHTEMVINVGSSMVFDYAAFVKPCAYINYDIADCKDPNWSAAKLYNFIHFRTMTDSSAVFWINSKPAIAETIKTMLTSPEKTVAEARRWFQKIVMHPPAQASERIWESFDQILEKS